MSEYRGVVPCQSDPDLFFSEELGSTAKARAMCAPCPMRLACLSQAISDREEFGVWGGSTPMDRRAALALDKGWNQKPTQHIKYMKCPACKSQDLRTWDKPSGLRWPSYFAGCNACDFQWQTTASVRRYIQERESK